MPMYLFYAEVFMKVCMYVLLHVTYILSHISFFLCLSAVLSTSEKDTNNISTI